MDVSSFSGFFDGSLQKSRRAACCIEPFSLRCARCFSYFLLSLWPPSIFNDLSLRPPGSRIWWCIWNGIQSGTHEPVGGTYQQTVNGSFAAISTQASKQVRPVLLEEKKKEKRPILQANTRWKALAEIYAIHSFAQLCNLIFCQSSANSHTFNFHT